MTAVRSVRSVVSIWGQIDSVKDHGAFRGSLTVLYKTIAPLLHGFVQNYSGQSACLFIITIRPLRASFMTIRASFMRRRINDGRLQAAEDGFANQKNARC
jgi:hypothetical protein